MTCEYVFHTLQPTLYNIEIAERLYRLLILIHIAMSNSRMGLGLWINISVSKKVCTPPKIVQVTMTS